MAEQLIHGAQDVLNVASDQAKHLVDATLHRTKEAAPEPAGMEGTGAEGGGAAEGSAGPVVDPNSVPTLKLNTVDGAQIPMLGLGTWQMGDRTYDNVLHGIKAGYRLIDTAMEYGQEAEVGRAIRDALSDGSLASRDDLFIVTKLWNSDHGRVAAALDESLGRLGMDHVDAYLMHWPVVSGAKGSTLQPSLSQTWSDMEGLVRSGKARSIGVANFSIPKLKALLKGCSIRPALLQNESHVYWRNDKTIDFAGEQSIVFMAYSPLGTPDSAPVFHKEGAPHPHDDPEVKRIAAEHGVSTFVVMLRWQLQRGVVSIPKSTKEGHMDSNLRDTLRIRLDDEDMKALSSLPHQTRMVDGSLFLDPEGPYKTYRDLWDE